VRRPPFAHLPPDGGIIAGSRGKVNIYDIFLVYSDFSRNCGSRCRQNWRFRSYRPV